MLPRLKSGQIERRVLGVILCAIALSTYLRLLPLRFLDGSVLELDAIRFLRQAELISKGRLPEVDLMRSFPEGHPTDSELTLFPHLLSLSHQVLRMIRPNIRLYDIAIVYPVVAFAVSIIVLYCLAASLTNRDVALITVAFAVINPALVGRSLAGFSDHDALSLLLGLIALLLYVRSIRVKALTSRRLYLLASGVATGMLGVTWRGVGFVVLIIIGTEWLMLLWGGYTIERVVNIGLWLLPVTLLLVLPKTAYRDLSAPFTTAALLIPLSFLLGAASYVLVGRLNSQALRILPMIVGLGVMALALMGAILRTENSIDIWLQHPLGKNRVLQTIDELEPGTFLQWVGWLGILIPAILSGLALLGYRLAQWIGFIPWLGAILVFAPFSAILIGTVFHEFTIAPGLRASDGLYMATIVTIVLTALSAAIVRRKRGTIHQPVDQRVIFLVVYIFLALALARTARRFEFFATPPLLIVGCIGFSEIFRHFLGDRGLSRTLFVCVALVEIWSLEELTFYEFAGLEDRRWTIIGAVLLSVALFFWWGTHAKISGVSSFGVRHMIASVIVGILGITAAVPPVGFTATSYRLATSVRPLVNKEMRTAFSLVKTHTPKGSAIAASWEWGSAINYYANRPSLIDDAQVVEAVHRLARHVIVAQSEKEALQYLRAYKTDYVLLCSRDIAFLPAHSFVGSDESADRRFVLPVYGELAQEVISDKGTKAYRYSVFRPYRTPEVRELFPDEPPTPWILVGIYLIVRHVGTPEVTGAVVEYQYRDRVIRVPPQEVYFRNLKTHTTNGEAAPCTLVIHAPSNDPLDWRVLYLNPTARRSLAIRLFLLGERVPHFNLVFTSGSSFGNIVQLWKVVSTF